VQDADEPTVVAAYTDGESVWTLEQLRGEVFPAQIAALDIPQLTGGEPRFEDWLAESCNTGICKKVEETVCSTERLEALWGARQRVPRVEVEGEP